MWISGPTEGLENIFLLLQSTSNPDKRVYGSGHIVQRTIAWVFVSTDEIRTPALVVRNQSSIDGATPPA